MIFEHAIRAGSMINIEYDYRNSKLRGAYTDTGARSLAALLRVNKLFHAETQPLLYQANAFKFGSIRLIKSWVGSIARSTAQLTTIKLSLQRDSDFPDLSAVAAALRRAVKLQTLIINLKKPMAVDFSTVHALITLHKLKDLLLPKTTSATDWKESYRILTVLCIGKWQSRGSRVKANDSDEARSTIVQANHRLREAMRVVMQNKQRAQVEAVEQGMKEVEYEATELAAIEDEDGDSEEE